VGPAGLRRMRWHDLRHTFASQLMMASVPVRQVQDWMGHSTITMTMRYAHLAPDGGADLIRALETPPGNGTLMAPRSAVETGLLASLGEGRGYQNAPISANDAPRPAA
jgi:hypothetical protein